MPITLNSKTRKSLQSGIDKLGMEETKKRLEGAGALSGLQDQAQDQAQTIKSTGIKPVSSPVSKITTGGADTSGLEKAKGFEKGQVGMEGINLFKKPPTIGAGAPEGKIDTEIKTEEGVTDGTKGIGAIGLDGTPGAGGETSAIDINKDGMLDESELSGDYKTFYDGLSSTEKKLFLAEGENALKNNLDIAEAYANYMRDYETIRSRGESDEEYRKKIEAMRGEAAEITENQTIRRAKDGVKKLKQSINYLGNLGMPGVSAQRMVSIENVVNEAETSLRETQKLLALAKSARALGEMQKALEYERQMEDVATKLNDNVDSAIQDTFNTLVQMDNNGKLDTVEEITAFRNKMYQDLDASITGFTDASIEQMKFLVNRVDVARQEAITYEENQNTVNQDMSAVKGYYVNGNGSPIYGTDGGTIKIPTQIPEGFEPFVSNGKFFSPKLSADGEIVKDVNGSPIFNSTQLEDTVSVTSQLANAYIGMVNKGTMTAAEAIKLVPELATNQAFISGVEADTETIKGNYKEDSEGRLYNADTGKYADDVGETDSNISEEDAVLWTYQLEDGTEITASKGTVNGLSKIMAQNPDIQFDLNNLYRTQEDQYRLYGQGRTASELKAAGVPEQYANPGENVVTWSLTSSHMSGNAVDVVLPEGQDKIEYFKGIDQEMNKNGFFRPEETMAEGDYGHYEYKGVAEGKEFSQKAQDWGQQILAGDAKIGQLTGKANIALKNEVVSYLATKAKTTQNPNISQFKESMSLIDELINHPGREAATGVPNFFTNPFGFAMPTSNARGFQAKLNQLDAKNFMTGIAGMKGMGSLSDAEGARVSKAVAAIVDTGISEDEFVSNLKILKSLLNNKIRSVEIETGITYDDQGFAVDGTTEEGVGGGISGYKDFLPEGAKTLDEGLGDYKGFLPENTQISSGGSLDEADPLGLGLSDDKDPLGLGL